MSRNDEYNKHPSRTRADIAQSLIKDIGLNGREAKEMVDLFFQEISDALVSQRSVKLSGFGRFNLRDKNCRPGRNPKTGESVVIKERRVVTFNASERFKKRINIYQK